MELFNLPQHFLIPLFQRPYVWEEADQWAPLWRDVRRAADARTEGQATPSRHFLGAVVLQATENKSGHLPAWSVIDGQQRLTTLQILMDATQAELASPDLRNMAQKLESLTHNADFYVQGGTSTLKLRHLNRDGAAFDKIMNASPEDGYDEIEHASSRIGRAHSYFRRMVNEWLGQEDGATRVARAEHLTEVLLNGIQLISIDLAPGEDSQEIFETLNARGTPLTAADLVRNYVFQRLDAEGADSRRAYERDWPFETKFWETEVGVGRQLISRSSLFLNQWLTSRTGEEVSTHTTFASFKRHVEQDPEQTMTSLLGEIRFQAELYQIWTESAARTDGNLSPVEMSVYRMRAAGIEILKPVLIWLTDPELKLPAPVMAALIRCFESWVYRRQLLRLTNSDLGRVVAEVIRLYRRVSPDQLEERVVAHLMRLNVTSTYWPGDDEIRRALASEPVFRRYPRARLRMYLEAIEDRFRAKTHQPQVHRGKLPIEHVLPQAWQDSWPVDSEENIQRRNDHVHRLGNLTLLTTSLNSKVSNGSWAQKRPALLAHNTMTMTGRILAATEESPWDEKHIDRRTSELGNALLSVWPVPISHEGKVLDPQTKAGDWIELKHLLAAGLLTPGDKLVAMHKDFVGVTVTVLPDGRLQDQITVHATPSAAGKALRKKSTNGWYFWGLPDGRRLRDIRAAFVAGAGVSQPGA